MAGIVTFGIGLLIALAGIVDVTGESPTGGMVFIGLILMAIGGYLIYKKHFSKF